MNEPLRDPAAELVEQVARTMAEPGSALALGAALRARAAGAPDALVLAALLHAAAGGADDPRVAAAWLGRSFGPAVSEPVRLLGDAERWLATVDRSWFEALDLAGLAALRARGGPLGPVALRSFERRPYALDAARLVRWIAEERAGAPRPVGAGEPFHWAELVRRVSGRDTRLTA